MASSPQLTRGREADRRQLTALTFGGDARAPQVVVLRRAGSVEGAAPQGAPVGGVSRRRGWLEVGS